MSISSHAPVAVSPSTSMIGWLKKWLDSIEREPIALAIQSRTVSRPCRVTAPPPYATVTSWLMRAQTRVRLEATSMAPFGTVWTTPSRSRRVVRRRLKSSTVPLTPASRTTSPFEKWFSMRISAPLR